MNQSDLQINRFEELKEELDDIVLPSDSDLNDIVKEIGRKEWKNLDEALNLESFHSKIWFLMMTLNSEDYELNELGEHFLKNILKERTKIDFKRLDFDKAMFEKEKQYSLDEESDRRPDFWIEIPYNDEDEEGHFLILWENKCLKSEFGDKKLRDYEEKADLLITSSPAIKGFSSIPDDLSHKEIKYKEIVRHIKEIGTPEKYSSLFKEYIESVKKKMPNKETLEQVVKIFGQHGQELQYLKDQKKEVLDIWADELKEQFENELGKEVELDCREKKSEWFSKLEDLPKANSGRLQVFREDWKGKENPLQTVRQISIHFELDYVFRSDGSIECRPAFDFGDEDKDEDARQELIDKIEEEKLDEDGYLCYHKEDFDEMRSEILEESTSEVPMGGHRFLIGDKFEVGNVENFVDKAWEKLKPLSKIYPHIQDILTGR